MSDKPTPTRHYLPASFAHSTIYCGTQELLRLVNRADDAHTEGDAALLTATLQELHDSLLALELVAYELTQL